MMDTFAGISTPMLAAADSAAEASYWVQGAQLMVVGMVVVFVALALTGTMIFLLNLLARERPKVATAAAPAPAAAPARAAQESIDAPTMAAIAAAVYAVAGRTARIRRVHFVRRAGGQHWAEQGRTAIQTSHRVRRYHR